MTLPRSPGARSGVFISYSRKDGESFAGDLRQRIEREGIAIWQDRTGMEGGRDWWEQIAAALNHVEYLVLVMTPAALASAIVRKEWRYARQQGVCVYPVIADSGIDMTTLPRWMSSVHWYDLKHQERKFVNDLNTRCQVRRVPFMVEDLTDGFVARDEQFAALKTLLLTADRADPVAVTAALRGAGGYGKTTLARALCHDEDIQNAFDDGILWVTLGEAPSAATLISTLGDLIETLSDERPRFEGLDAAATRFRELLADRDLLLVIDDVWRAGDLRPFLQGGERCARLITTRRADTLPPSARNVPVDAMRAAEARQLIAQGLPPGHEERLVALADQLGEWPLLLKLANAMLRKRVRDVSQPVPDAIAWVRTALNKRGLTAFDARDPQQRSDAAASTLEVSLAGLDPVDRERLLELAVFPEDLKIPLRVLEHYWQHTAGLDPFDVEDTCLRLFNESLLQLDLNERHVRLHDAIRTWLIERPGSVAIGERHARLLAAYEHPKTRWEEIPDDGYLHQHLAEHLVAASRQDELRCLLFSLDWIRLRLRSTDPHAGGRVKSGVFELLHDYDFLPDAPDVELLRRALQMSAHIIGRHPDAVGQQLFGRLAMSELLSIRRLCDQASQDNGGVSLWPLRPALDSPGALVLTLGSHTDHVRGSTLLPDGRRALSWSRDGTLRLWDLERGELLHSLTGHAFWVDGATLLADGRRALSWSKDHTLKLWDLERGELLHSLAGHEDDVQGATLLADGQRALSWSDDGTLKLWDLERGALLHSLAGHKADVKGATLLADGQRALSWSRDHTLKLWDLERGILLHSESSVLGATLLADGRRALSWSNNRTLQLWDLERGELLHSLTGHHDWTIHDATVCADGRRALSWEWFTGTLNLWDLERGEFLCLLAGHEGRVGGATVLADGRRALSWSNDGTLKLWDLDSGILLHSLCGHEQCVNAATVFADGRRALSWSNDGTLKLWDLDSGERLLSLVGHEDRVGGATLLADGRRALSWSDDGTLKLWDFDSGEPLHSLADSEDRVKGTTLLADSRRALSWSVDGTLKLWDLERGELLHSLAGPESSIKSATLLPDGRRALSWSEDPTLKLWNLESGILLHSLAGHESSIKSAALLADGRRALSWSDDPTLRLWDLESGILLHSLAGHESSIKSAALLADGRRALSWSDDPTLRLWDLQNGMLLHSLVRESKVDGVTVLADGRRALLYGGRGDTLDLWDLERGELLHSLAGHESTVFGATPLADGRRVLSWSQDSTLKLWDLDSGELLYSLVDHENWVNGATLFADGRRALSWSDDHTLKLWDLERGELLHSLAGHEDDVQGATLLADGQLALSWSPDRTLRLWSLDQAREIAVYFSDAALSKPLVGLNGTRMFASDVTGHIHLLRLQTDDS